ncbi:MAG: imidazole glycerol phosphate synthase subunit HisH, partial [Candidatus Omnitrophica bacterium]|nr:imidazole glycerol phosphate synthase subunit HisH [Candidatus Omnitrophota bacterium]
TSDILNADKVILPGVGTFGDGMEGLKKYNIDKALIEYVKKGKQVLGICLGMQLFMSSSEEFGYHQGLNLIDGQVIKLTPSNSMNQRYKIPHIGWNRIFPKETPKTHKRHGNILRNNSSGEFFYFVHSYRVVPNMKEQAMAVTEYGGTEFCSVINKDNIYGCQFHPELSGETGLNFLRGFLCTGASNINKETNDV